MACPTFLSKCSAMLASMRGQRWEWARYPIKSRSKSRAYWRSGPDRAGHGADEFSGQEGEMASIVKRLLLLAFLLVPTFGDAQTLGPDATPKAFLQMIDRPRAPLTPSQNNQRAVNGIEHWH